MGELFMVVAMDTDIVMSMIGVRARMHTQLTVLSVYCGYWL